MKFKEFMDLFDNWNGITKVNDIDLKMIIRHKTVYITENCKDLFDLTVVSFGFYDGELTVCLGINLKEHSDIHYECIEEIPPINGIDFDYDEMISIIHGCKSNIALDKLTLERYHLKPEVRISFETTIRTNERIINKIADYVVTNFKK